MAFGAIVEGALDLVSGGVGKALSSASVFQIEELSGQKRRVELSGRGLPYRPFDLPVSQRLTTTWNPGFAEATATVLGPMDEPTTINGMWKDRFIQNPSRESLGGGVVSDVLTGVTAVSGTLSGGFGDIGEFKPPILVDGEGVPSVVDAITLMDSITREGQLIEVTWHAQRRQGFLRRLVPSWENDHDCAWEMHFEWIGRGEKPELFEEAQSVASVFEEITGIVDDLGAILNEVGAIADELDDLVTSQLQAIVALTETIGAAAQSVNKLVNLPSSAAKRTVATLNSVIARAKEMAESFEAEPYAAQHRDGQRADGFGATSVRSSALTQTGPAGNVDSFGVQQVSPVDIVGRVDVAFRVKRSARRLWSVASLRRSQLLRTLITQLQETYQAKQGENLREVAQKVYGDSGQWRRLMIFNELSTPVLARGQVVLIPTVSVEGGCASILP